MRVTQVSALQSVCLSGWLLVRPSFRMYAVPERNTLHYQAEYFFFQPH